jgi:14-3-3 protein epsilon
MNELEELSSLAQISLVAERYQDASKYIEELIKKKKDDLSIGERNIFYNSFKFMINSKRNAWISANLMEDYLNEEDKEENIEKINIVKNYKIILENEVFNICKVVIFLINEFLLTKTILDESKIFYLRMKGDYYRYLCEFKSLSENKNYIEESEKNYKMAVDLSQNVLSINPIKLGLYLNYSVFYYEIKKDKKKAIQIAKEAVKNTKKYSDKLKKEEDKDTEMSIQALKKNINNWEDEERKNIN